jgi:hypothetical protein
MSTYSECIICYESIIDNETIVFANCTHGNCAHTTCMQNWNNTCPLCRQNIYPVQEDINSNITNHVINRINTILINHNDVLHDYLINNINNVVDRIYNYILTHNINHNNYVYDNHINNNINNYINNQTNIYNNININHNNIYV